MIRGKLKAKFQELGITDKMVDENGVDSITALLTVHCGMSIKDTMKNIRLPIPPILPML